MAEPYTLVVDANRYGDYTVEAVAAAVEGCQGRVAQRRFFAVLGESPGGRICMNDVCGVVVRLSWHGATGQGTNISADIELLDTAAGRAAGYLLMGRAGRMGLVGAGDRDAELHLAGVSILGATLPPAPPTTGAAATPG